MKTVAWLTGAAFVATIVGWFIVYPWYTDNAVRTRVSGVITLLGSCEPYMAAQFGSQQRFFSSDGKPSDCRLPESTPYVSAFRVSGGRVEAQLRDIHPDLDGKAVFIEAVADKSSKAIQNWRCGTNASEKAYKFIPRGCPERG